MSARQKTTKKPKAAKEAERQSQRLPVSTLLKNAGRAAALLLVAGLASPVSQLNLSPIYGSIPASLHHQRCLQVVTGVALLVRQSLKRYASANVAEYVAVLAYWTPVIQYLLFPHSGELGIVYGPMIIEALTYFPLLFLSVYAAADLLTLLCLNSVPSPVSSMLLSLLHPMSRYPRRPRLAAHYCQHSSAHRSTLRALASKCSSHPSRPF